MARWFRVGLTTPSSAQVTPLLMAVNHGDVSAPSELWKLVYDELHAMAQHQMAKEASGRTPQTTSLVHEAYLRLMGGEDVQWTDRRHFFGAVANAMRQIPTDAANSVRCRARHPGRANVYMRYGLSSAGELSRGAIEISKPSSQDAQSGDVQPVPASDHRLAFDVECLLEGDYITHTACLITQWWCPPAGTIQTSRDGSYDRLRPFRPAQHPDAIPTDKALRYSRATGSRLAGERQPHQ